jgi:ABC-type glycerol-3-phosphate transport system permease component
MAEISLRTTAAKLERSGIVHIATQIFQKTGIYTLLISWAFLAVVPFVWMLSTSVMTLGEAQGVRFFPSEVHIENYVEAWRVAEFAEYFFNSVQITTITLVGQLVVSILAAYAFARIQFPGRDVIFGVMLSTMMIPAMVLTIPNFLTVTWLGRIGPLKWINNWPALTVPFWGSVFSIFLLRQFFAQIPDELFDAAQIDGAGHLRFLMRIVIPLSKAPLMVIVVLSFMGSWNALAWPLLVTNTPEWRPIAVGLYSFVQEAGQKINLMMAGAVITIIPILILYFITQKQFTESIARSGLKG